MESFTLGPTPKIDFRCSTSHLWQLQRDLELVWALVEFNTEFLQFLMTRAFIYRLMCRMGDCCNMYGRSPDGQRCDRIFWKFRWKSFLFKSRVRTVRHWHPDGRTSIASNFHIRLRASGPRGMNVRTTILQHIISIYAMCASGPREADVRTVEVESAISLTDERASGPMLTDIQTVIFQLRFLPYLWARPDRKPHRPYGVSIFPYSELGKNLKLIDHW
jgi:hypothetical protein